MGWYLCFTVIDFTGTDQLANLEQLILLRSPLYSLQVPSLLVIRTRWTCWANVNCTRHQGEVSSPVQAQLHAARAGLAFPSTALSAVVRGSHSEDWSTWTYSSPPTNRRITSLGIHFKPTTEITPWAISEERLSFNSDGTWIIFDYYYSLDSPISVRDHSYQDNIFSVVFIEIANIFQGVRCGGRNEKFPSSFLQT